MMVILGITSFSIGSEKGVAEKKVHWAVGVRDVGGDLKHGYYTYILDKNGEEKVLTFEEYTETNQLEMMYRAELLASIDQDRLNDQIKKKNKK
jgi:hypothetical protein